MNPIGTRQWLGIGSVAASLVVFGVTRATAETTPVAVPGSTAPVVVAAPPTSRPSISGDGRFVVYAAPPAVADGRTSSAWLRDQESGEALELTVPGNGMRAGETVTPVISADGCTAVVVTELALDLFGDDDGGARWDVYGLLLPHCSFDGEQWTAEWFVISERNGEASNDVVPGSAPAVSGAGTVIAYTREFSVVAPELTTVAVTDLSIEPGAPGRVTSVLGTPADEPQTTFVFRGLRDPAISDDGTIVAFASDANSDLPEASWAAGPADGAAALTRIFVWDRANSAGVVTAITPANANNHSTNPSLSGDGTRIAFESLASNLVDNTRFSTCDATCAVQVFVASATASGDFDIQLVSGLPATSSAPAEAANGAALDPVISADGSTVVFVSRASNLFAISSGASGGVTEGDVVAVNVATHQMRRISTLPDGVTPSPPHNAAPAVSATARVVVFDSTSNGFTPDMTAAFGNGRNLITHSESVNLALADLDVGTVVLNIEGPEWFVKLINNGNTSFVPGTIEVSDPQFTLTGGAYTTCYVGVALAPGDECSIALTMTPTAAGNIAANLTVTELGYLGSSISARLTGAGGEPKLNPAPGSAGGRWEPLVVGTEGEKKSFSIMNVGFAPLAASSVKVVGDMAGDFDIVDTDCKQEFGVGQTCVVDVVFTPSRAGHRQASLRIATAEGFYTTVLLDGDGYYNAAISADRSDIVAGQSIEVSGTGFAPRSPVSLVWADGSGATFATITDGWGNFTVTVTVGTSERTGLRMLVAQTATGESSVVEVRIAPKPKSITPASPLFD